MTQPAFHPAERQHYEAALKAASQSAQHNSSELLARVRIDLRPGKRQDRA